MAARAPRPAPPRGVQRRKRCPIACTLTPPAPRPVPPPTPHPRPIRRRGGSFYIQSKVWNAKEALLEDLRRQERAAEKAASAASAKGPSSPGAGGSGDKFSGVRGEHAGLFGGSGTSAFASGGRRWVHTAASAGRPGAGEGDAASQLR